MLRCYEPGISPAYRKSHTRRQHRAALTWGVVYYQSARRTGIRSRRVAGLLIAVAALAAARGLHPPVSSPSAAAPANHVAHRKHHHALGAADGAVRDGTTVFDDQVPGVANLDPALLGALREAASAAAGDGIELVVDSGWRSPEYQRHLLEEAVSKYGSKAE